MLPLNPALESSRDSWVDIATGFELDGRGSNSGSGKRFYLLHSDQTGSGVHKTSYTLGTEGGEFFTGG
jgi:hypothetical protein